MAPTPVDHRQEVINAVREAIANSREASRFGFRVAANGASLETTSAGVEVPVAYDVDNARASELEEALRSLQREIDRRFPNEYINLYFRVLASDE